MAVGGVICCGRWRQGWRGCGVSRCWRWAAGCCEVWQGVQAVQLVGCGVIGAALAVLILPGAGGGRNIHALCSALPGYFPAFPRGGRRQHPARAGLLIRQAGQAGRWAKEKGQGRRRGVRCCSGLWSALAAMVPAGCVPVPVVGLICWRCRWAWSALAPFPLSAFQQEIRHAPQLRQVKIQAVAIQCHLADIGTQTYGLKHRSQEISRAFVRLLSMSFPVTVPA